MLSLNGIHYELLTMVGGRSEFEKTWMEKTSCNATLVKEERVAIEKKENILQSKIKALVRTNILSNPIVEKNPDEEYTILLNNYTPIQCKPYDLPLAIRQDVDSVL